jgi:glutathione S-transferase
MITLFGYPGSRSLRAAWALEEAGADYLYQLVDLKKGEGRMPEFLRINPGGKVPALMHDDFVLTESAAICNYVGDIFPASGLTPPAGSRQRAVYDRWCYFAATELEQPLWTLAKHRFALPERWRVPAIMPTAEYELSVAIKVLEAGLGEQRYILGDQFTAADILISNTLKWARTNQLLPMTDQFHAYLERTLGRPALLRAEEREKHGQ